MKKILFVGLVTLCLLLSSCGQTPAQSEGANKYDGYKLVFEEEFEGDKINREIWGNEIGFIRNNEPQYYTDRTENAYVKDGNLVISAFAENFEAEDGTTASYTSASINTLGKKSFKYGKIEMRAKLPVTECKASWAAFWMMGETINTLNWPRCGEIDILEAYGTNLNRYYVTAHWFDDAKNEYNNSNKVQDVTFIDHNQPLGNDYNVYGVEWTSESFTWYFNDKIVGTFQIGENMDELKEPMYLLLNLALTQEGDRTQLDNGEKLNYLIDWVRVYQK